MKLKKFTKNKKIKTIFIGSIIGILLVVGGISLYRSFAMYKVEKTFDVLQGTVPDFRKKIYTEKLLNGADPVLDEEGELVPVKIGNNGEVTKADITQEWYSYEKKEWANAVILTDAGKQQNIGVNEKIEEQYIESYFVWIPKYRYKLFDMGNYQNYSSTIVDKGPTNAIAIEFGLTDTVDDETKEEYKQCETPMNEDKTQGVSGASGNCHEGDWMTHPAFISFKTNGLWVGKFETGYKNATTTQGAQQNNSTSANIVIKPDQFSWRDITIGNSYTASLNYKKELLSHNMKNTEWGAVAYLTQSIYGRCSNNGNGTTCTEVAQNTNSNFKTGYNNNTVAYPNSKNASTTGNNTGIFDMNGGAYEQQVSVGRSPNSDTPYWSSSGLNGDILNDERYYDLYNYRIYADYFDMRILGDATVEMGPFKDSMSSYFYDQANIIYNATPWFYRGCHYYCNSVASGIFAFWPYFGNAVVYDGFRIVLAPK